MQTTTAELEQQLPFLLPSQKDFDAMERQGGWENEDGVNIFYCFVNSVRVIIDSVINAPYDSRLWMELAGHFGTINEIHWKFVYIAHHLDPDNIHCLEKLSSVIYRIGDTKQAIRLIDNAIAVSESEEVRMSAIQTKAYLVSSVSNIH